MANLNVTIVWEGDEGHESYRPAEVVVAVMCLSIQRAKASITAAENWEHIFGNMQDRYGYSMTVTNEIQYYEWTSTGDGLNRNFTITMTYNGPTDVWIPTTLVLQGDADHLEDRPESVTLRLYEQGSATVFDEQTFAIVDGVGTGQFKNLSPDQTYTGVVNSTDYYVMGDLTWLNNNTEVSIALDYDRPWRTVTAAVVVEDDRGHGLPRDFEVLLTMNGYGQPKLYTLLVGGDDKIYVEIPDDIGINFTASPESGYNLTSQVAGDDTIFTYTKFWTPFPMPKIGDHPTKEDLDLMYSLLYDNVSAENAIDIIYILNHGGHDPDYGQLTPFIR